MNFWAELIKQLPEHSLIIKKAKYRAIAAIMDMMIPWIQFYHDLKNHEYFFAAPNYEEGFSPKFKARVMSSPEWVEKTLSDLYTKFDQIDSSNFLWNPFNKVCSEYLSSENQAERSLKSEEVYFLLRYAITGNPVGAPIGEIIEVIGKKQTLSRILKAKEHLAE